MTEQATAIMDNPSVALAKTGQMGRLMVESGRLSADDLETIVEVQEKRRLRFGEAAVALGLVTREDVKAVLAQQFSYSIAPLADSRLDPVLLAAFRPQSRRVEALRGLRSELMLRYFDNPDRRVLPLIGVDDAQSSGELTANLAIVCSQLGARTLLIDANLRQPSLHKLFDLPNHQGLSDVLADRGAAMPQLCSPLQSLWLLNGGTVAPNPQELLTHQRYYSLMSSLSEQYDVILANTPPLTENLDAQLIGARAGAALLIAKEHVTSLRSLEHVSRRLQDVGVSVLGVALSQ